MTAGTDYLLIARKHWDRACPDERREILDVAADTVTGLLAGPKASREASPESAFNHLPASVQLAIAMATAFEEGE